MNKYEWKKIKNPQEMASEGGIALIAEEYDGTLICLERCDRYDAITCGGGWVHTMFVNPDHSMETYEAMKKDLADFTDRVDDMSSEERSDYLRDFTHRYWE